MKILTRKEYLENQIHAKKSENIAAQVEYDFALRMSMGGKHVQQFEQAMVMFKNKMKANEEAISFYQDQLDKEK